MNQTPASSHIPSSASPTAHGLRALVVDEWALFRQGVGSVLTGIGVEIIGQAATVDDAVLRIWSGKPDLLVAGSPAHGRVSELVAAAKRARPDLRVLALLPVSGVGELRPVLAAGADSVLSRTVEAHELEDAVRKLAAGERVMAAGAVFAGLGSDPGHRAAVAAHPGHALSGKELEVLGLLAQNLSNLQIAQARVVSESTVRSQLRSIYEKLGARDRREAVRRAIELGILG